jgi:Catalase
MLYWHDIFANKLLQLGVQIFDEDQQLAFGFDVLDDTKFIPEEVVPVTPLGVMTLNANPQNWRKSSQPIWVFVCANRLLSFNLDTLFAVSTFLMTQFFKVVSILI